MWVGKARKQDNPNPIPQTPPPQPVRPARSKVKIEVVGKAVHATYPDCSVARLFGAAVRAVTEMGYSITNSDSTTGTLSFRTGMSMKSWQGQEMTASIASEGAGAAKIIVGGRRVTRGYQLQVFDWGEAKSIAHKFLDHLTSAVAEATPEMTSDDSAATPSPGPSVSTAAELERVARLHKQGLLTEDEFAAAKKKLLA